TAGNKSGTVGISGETRGDGRSVYSGCDTGLRTSFSLLLSQQRMYEPSVLLQTCAPMDGLRVAMDGGPKNQFCLNGIPSCLNSSRASSSLRALVTIVTFIPRIFSTFA